MISIFGAGIFTAESAARHSQNQKKNKYNCEAAKCAKEGAKNSIF